MTWFHAWSGRAAPFDRPAASDAPPAVPPQAPDSTVPPGVSSARRTTLAGMFVDAMCDSWFGKRGVPKVPVLPMDTWPMPYIAPNEHHPARMLPLTCTAMRGVYVGVGTERCWMAAAMHPQLARLYLVDRDPRVVYYNRVNLALLNAAAGARVQYIHLRLTASQPEWEAAAEGLPPPRRGLLRDPEAHAWWDEHVRCSPTEHMARFHRPGRDRAFAGANYMWNDALFANVSRFATDEAAVDIRQLELSSTAQVNTLRRVLAWRQETISLLDISNAWWPAYLPAPTLQNLLEQLRPVLCPESLLLATHRARLVAAPVPARHSRWERPSNGDFHYFTAHPLAVLQDWPAFQRYLTQLRDGLDGPGAVNRLFTPPAKPAASPPLERDAA